MIDTGWMLFGTATAETVSGSLSDWANAGNGITVDVDVARTVVPEGYPTIQKSEVIKFTNLVFPFAIGAAASYNVDFRIKRTASGGGHFIADELVRMIINGSLTGNNLAATSTKWGALETVDYTGDWDISFIQSMFNSAMGIAIQVSDTDSGGNADIITVWMRVQYEEITGPSAREVIQYS